MLEEEPILFKKIYGRLTGGLVGDAMGGPNEGMHYEEIEQKYGRITRLMDYKGRPAGKHLNETTEPTSTAEALLFPCSISSQEAIFGGDKAP